LWHGPFAAILDDPEPLLKPRFAFRVRLSCSRAAGLFDDELFAGILARLIDEITEAVRATIVNQFRRKCPVSR
jgi:hypothetical protein